MLQPGNSWISCELVRLRTINDAYTNHYGRKQIASTSRFVYYFLDKRLNIVIDEFKVVNKSTKKLGKLIASGSRKKN